MRWAGDVAPMGNTRDGYRLMVEIPEGNRPLRRPRCRWKDYIKVRLQEAGRGGMDWIVLV
jgi:hypothetical protein